MINLPVAVVGGLPGTITFSGCAGHRAVLRDRVPRHIGMMTRTARGHTGRPLQADRIDVMCYLLVSAAPLLRVGVPLVAPSLTSHAVLCSAALWSSGFALYTLHYWPVLTRARLDGKPG